MPIGEILGALGAAGSKGILGGLLDKLFNPSLEEQTDERIRANNVNQFNDFERFLAQLKTTDPNAAVKDLVKSRTLAGLLGLKRGTGVDFSREGVTAKKSEDPTAGNPQLQAIINTLMSPGKSNLSQNQRTGLLDFNAPSFKPVSKVPNNPRPPVRNAVRKDDDDQFKFGF